MRMRNGLNEFIRVPEDFVGHLHHESKPQYQAFHFLLAPHFDAQFLAESLKEPMRSPTGSHQLDIALHAFEGHTVGGCGGGDERGNEGDAAA